MAHTVMVTGADGFIVSHLTEELVKRGEKVRAFCLYNSFGSLGWIDTLPPEIRSEIDIFMGDVRDPNGVRTAMRGQERVFHLAALIAIPFSYIPVSRIFFRISHNILLLEHRHPSVGMFTSFLHKLHASLAALSANRNHLRKIKGR